MKALIRPDQKTLVVKDGSGKTVLHIACLFGHLSIVQVVESHLDQEKLQEMYELCDNEGNTLLHLACQSQTKNVVQHLVHKGRANINARNYLKDREAPLHVAAQFQSMEIVDILLDHGADIKTTDANNCTPLHYAAKSNQKDMIQHLFLREQTLMPEIT